MQRSAFGRKQAAPPITHPTPPPIVPTSVTDTAARFAGKTKAPALAFVAGWETKAVVERVVPVGIGIAEFIKREIVETGGFVHAESALTAVGALAGMACQMAARHLPAHPKKPLEFQTSDGRLVRLDHNAKALLCDGELSFCHWIATAHRRFAPVELPDLDQVISGVLRSMIAEAAPPAANDQPFAFVTRFWVPLSQSLEIYLPETICWSLSFGAAYMRLIEGMAQMAVAREAPSIATDAAFRTLMTDPAAI